MLSRPPILLLVAAACAAAAALVYVLATGTTAGAHADAVALSWFTAVQSGPLGGPASDAVKFVDPRAFALLGAALAALGLAFGRLRHAAAALTILGGAALTSQLLKSALAATRPWEAPPDSYVALAAWPSGHATGSLAVAVCLVLVVPDRFRTAAVLVGGGFAGAVACAVLAVGSHYPSDVLGGMLVALAWTALGVAALRATDARAAAAGPLPRWLSRAAAGLAVVAASALAAYVASRPDAALDFAKEHTALCAAALPLAAACLALVVTSAMAPFNRG